MVVSFTSWGISSATTTRRSLEAMASLRTGRAQRIEAMVARLRDARALDRSGRGSAGLPPRRAWAAAISPTTWRGPRQVASMREVFARYLGDGCPACVEKPRLDSRPGDRLDPGGRRRGRAGASAP